MARAKRLIGLDVGSSEVKLIDMSHDGNSFTVHGYGQKPLPAEGNKNDVIRELLTETGVKHKRCVTALSGRSVIVRYVSMPPSNEEQMRKAVVEEADKYIPFDINEVVIDCQAVEDAKPDAHEVKVLLVAVKRTLVNEHVSLLKGCGLTSEVIDVDAFALGNSLQLVRNTNPGAIPEDKVIALIDIGHTKSNVNILQGKTSYFTREVYVAGKDITENIAKQMNINPAEAEALKLNPADRFDAVKECATPVFEDLGNEVRLCFDYFENQFDKQVDTVYLAGGTAFFNGIVDVFSMLLDKPASLWNPLEGLQVDSGNVDVEKLKAKSPQLTIAVGLASRVLG